MAPNRSHKLLRLYFTVLVCAFLLILIVSLKAPLPSRVDGLVHPIGIDPWTSGQKLQLPSVVAVAPIFFVFFVLVAPERQESRWYVPTDAEVIPRHQDLVNL